MTDARYWKARAELLQEALEWALESTEVSDRERFMETAPPIVEADNDGDVALNVALLDAFTSLRMTHREKEDD